MNGQLPSAMAAPARAGGRCGSLRRSPMKCGRSSATDYAAACRHPSGSAVPTAWPPSVQHRVLTPKPGCPATSWPGSFRRGDAARVQDISEDFVQLIDEDYTT